MSEYLPELLGRHHGGRLKFSTSVLDAVEDSEVIFITVGTPQSETGEADLSYVEAVAREMGPAIREPKVIVEKSTVPVKTAESLRRTLLLSGAKPRNVLGSFESGIPARRDCSYRLPLPGPHCGRSG